MISSKPIAQSLSRLAASDTPIKRRNALRHFRRLMREFEAAVTAEYRPMRADGSVVEATKRKGARCPYCKVPFRSMRELVRHLWNNHEWLVTDCVCGKYVGSEKILVRHLAAQRSIGVHVAKAALLETARKLRGEQP